MGRSRTEQGGIGDAHSKARLSIAGATWAAKDRIGIARRYEACSYRQQFRTIGRVVVSEPSDTPKRAGRPRSVEVLALNCERETRSLGQRETHRPDFEVNLIDLAWLERLAFVMRIIGEVFGGSLRIQFALRDSQPALRDR